MWSACAPHTDKRTACNPQGLHYNGLAMNSSGLTARTFKYETK